MDKIEQTWFAVVNPDAGSGKTLSRWRVAERMLFDKGIFYKFVTPESPSDSSRRIRTACHLGYRHFLAVGGDGTVHRVIGTIVDYVLNFSRDARLSDFTVAVLPIGSGNDWLRSHNLPHDHEQIIDLIAAGSFSMQDVVKAELLNPGSPLCEDGGPNVLKTFYMANIGGYAFDANVCDVVNFQKANGVTGKMMYLKALKGLALRQEISAAKLVCDGKEVFDGKLFSISFGNGLYSGGGLCQTPSAIMDDGLIDIMLAPKFPIYKLFLHVRKLLTKRIENIPFLRFFKASEILLLPEGQGQLIEMDGEIIGRAPLRLSILPDRLHVLHKGTD